ncbi:MAG TPA: hypothetical protein VND19_11465 [Acetobacteraceae bacterium]|nr:hypothetical protein [Acetobacteraceae bacterium]
MAKRTTPPTASDDQVRALLYRYNCPVPFHAVRTRWLGETEEDAASLLHPGAEDTLQVWPVSMRVYRPVNNNSGLLEAAEAVTGGFAQQRLQASQWAIALAGRHLDMCQQEIRP